MRSRCILITLLALAVAGVVEADEFTFDEDGLVVEVVVLKQDDSPCEERCTVLEGDMPNEGVVLVELDGTDKAVVVSYHGRGAKATALVRSYAIPPALKPFTAAKATVKHGEEIRFLRWRCAFTWENDNQAK